MCVIELLKLMSIERDVLFSGLLL